MTAYPDDDIDFRSNAISEIDEIIALLREARDQALTATVDMEEIEQLVGMVHLFTDKVTAALAGETVSAW
jgi:hypothetical protein